MSFDWYELSLDMSCRFLNLIWVVAWYELSLDTSCRRTFLKKKRKLVIAEGLKLTKNKTCALKFPLQKKLKISDDNPKLTSWSGVFK